MTGPTASPPPDPQEVLDTVGSSWVWTVGFGVATLVPGILVLAWPKETLHVLAVIIGIQLMVAGLFWFVIAFARREVSAGGRVVMMLIAMGAVLAGVLCLRHPLETIGVIALIVGAYWLISGIMVAFSAIAEPALGHRGLRFALGLLSVVAGIVVLGFPVESAVALARLLGLWLVLLGVAEIALGLVMSSNRRLTHTG